jgi:hypothetical protein
VVRIFVEEAPPPPIPPLEEWDAERCWLFVPSGRLEVRTATELRAGPSSSEAFLLDLPPGEYVLDAWENVRSTALDAGATTQLEQEVVVVLTRSLEQWEDE